MKKSASLFFLIFMGANAFGYTGYSVCHYDKQVMDSVVCYGPTVLNGTTVKGDVKVTGSLKAKNVYAKNLLIQGSAEINDSVVEETTRIVGSLNANAVEFRQGIAVESDEITLNHSTVNGLVTITAQQKNPVLQAQCSSVITGSVLFIGKAGVLQITGDSLLKGKVINGSMEFVKRECE